MSEQITREQAIEIHESGQWREWSHEQRAYFQLRNERLAMPFDVFHEAVQKTLGRPVLTHEFAQPDLLISELEGIVPAPTWEQIIEPIKDKMILVAIEDES
jgi:hypothetical protein